MATPERVKVRPISGNELRAAALVAARGMRDNPLNVAAIGQDPKRRERVLGRLFSRLLPLDGRPTLGAFDGEHLVAVADSARPGRCQPSAGDRLRLAPALLRAGTAGLRMGRWFSAWASRDLDRLHSHLGPMAVDPHFQGNGIGSAMLAVYCRGLDATGLVSYLETDKADNVRLYQRFGFAVTDEADVIGVTNWFMTRDIPPTSTRPE
jgi:ribosomal protein S18 acetylase RimI-like enzyme